MEQIIEAVANGLGNSIGFLAETGVLFALFAVIWIAFGAALIWGQGRESASRAAAMPER